MMHRAICLHTESLHNDQVWERVQNALSELDRRNIKITFLVYPLRAIAAGIDVRDRVKELAGRGHEVGQHTHFYVGQVTERTRKRTDLSDMNIRTCILRDYEWLGECGIEPKGFCSGNFMTTETVFETLAALGFVYDCSARLPWECKNYELPHSFMEGAQVRTINGSQLALLPNTEYLTLAQCFHPVRRRRSAPLANQRGRYQLIVNHDYDLLIGKVWLGLLWRLRRAGETGTVRQLAELCLEDTTDGQ